MASKVTTGDQFRSAAAARVARGNEHMHDLRRLCSINIENGEEAASTRTRVRAEIIFCTNTKARETETKNDKMVVPSNLLNGSLDSGSIRLLVQCLTSPILKYCIVKTCDVGYWFHITG